MGLFDVNNTDWGASTETTTLVKSLFGKSAKLASGKQKKEKCSEKKKKPTLESQRQPKFIDEKGKSVTKKAKKKQKRTSTSQNDDNGQSPKEKIAKKSNTSDNQEGADPTHNLSKRQRRRHRRRQLNDNKMLQRHLHKMRMEKAKTKPRKAESTSNRQKSVRNKYKNKPITQEEELNKTSRPDEPEVDLDEESEKDGRRQKKCKKEKNKKIDTSSEHQSSLKSTNGKVSLKKNRAVSEEHTVETPESHLKSKKKKGKKRSLQESLSDEDTSHIQTISKGLLLGNSIGTGSSDSSMPAKKKDKRFHEDSSFSAKDESPRKATPSKSAFDIGKLKAVLNVNTPVKPPVKPDDDSTQEAKSSPHKDTPKSLRARMQERLTSARFRFINEQLYSCTGEEAFKMMTEDPEAFQVYHQGFQAQVEKWPQNPVNRVISFIKKRPNAVVADFGCGDAMVAKTVSNTVHSFDLVAHNTFVTACDMANVPLEDDSVDIAVFCLALMGTNVTDFITEANRVLKERSNIMDRQAYFRGVRRDLEWAQSWEEFLEVGKRNYLKYNVEYELPKSLHTFGNEYIQARKDTVSQKLLPKDSFVKATPVQCFEDRNCLFRAVSLILQGDENLHLELRIRVVIEMAMNIDLYCSNEQMKTMNAKVQIPNPVDILWHTCIGKEHMKETVKESLKSQLMKWVKDGCFSSLWQIYAIANILLKPVATLYPQVFRLP